MLIIFVIIGMFIFGGLMLLATVSSLWLMESLDIVWSVYLIHQLGLYPLGLYNTVIKVLITCILPFAFVSYYPATYLLGKEGSNIALLAPIVMAIIWFVAIKTWGFALKRYKSSGS